MEKNFDQLYWTQRYQSRQTGWDIGYASTPIKEYIDQLADKNISIMIPGCGNAYEAEYLVEKGFTNITLVDISPLLVEALQRKFKSKGIHHLQFICDDFFNLSIGYDLIIEQTFFCALNPSLRTKYVAKMYDLLNPGGKLIGVLFDRDFIDGPPFGGSREEYISLFNKKFKNIQMEACYNSIGPRSGTELFIKIVR
jgi:methyl halide transferase